MKNLTPSLFAAALALSPTAFFAQTATEPAAPAAATVTQEITIEGNDQMQFNKKEFEVKAGEPIKLTLKHVGQLPKGAMGHNVVVLKPGTNLAAWASKAMTAAATDYVPADEESKKAVVAHTKVLGGGESDTITFTIEEAGEYQFLCSFPGHFALMQGKITVK